MISRRVSIITVCLNLIKGGRKDFFLNMMESVQIQDYIDIEHVIIDGGSTDGTIDMVERAIVKSRWPVIFSSEPDSGIFDAMNKGIKRSSGEYIVVLNSDDYYHNSKSIGMLVNCLEAGSHDIAFGAYLFLRSRDRNAIIKPSPEDFFYRMPVGHNATIVKRNFLYKNGLYDVKFKFTADYDFIYKSMLGVVSYNSTNDIVTVFRSGGLSKTMKKEVRMEVAMILRHYLEAGFSNRLIHKINSGHVGIYGYFKLRTGVRNRFIKEMLLKKFNFRYICGIHSNN